MGWYDTAQICLNGHVVNGSSRKKPQFNEKHCQKCGEATITTCINEGCKKDIRGDYHSDSAVVFIGSGGEVDPPLHCLNCGTPYPWTVRRNKIGARAKRAAVDVGKRISIAYVDFLSRFVDTSLGQTAIAILFGAIALILPSKTTLVVAMIVAGLLITRAVYRRGKLLRTSFVVGLTLFVLSAIVWKYREIHVVEKPPTTVLPTEKSSAEKDRPKTDVAKTETPQSEAKGTDKSDNTPTPPSRQQTIVPKTSDQPKRLTEKQIAPQPQINSAPNGIAIGGGTVNNPTVNNNNGLFPPAGVNPNISICFLKKNAPRDKQFESVFTIDTDTPISAPWWLFQFDKSIESLTPTMAGNQIFASSNNHPNSGLAGIVPENSMVLKIDNLGGIGSQAPWRPNQVITVTVVSPEPVALIQQFGGSAVSATAEALHENFSFLCGHSNAANALPKTEAKLQDVPRPTFSVTNPTGSIINQGSRVDASQTVNNFAPGNRHLTPTQIDNLNRFAETLPDDTSSHLCFMSVPDAESQNYAYEIQQVFEKKGKTKQLVNGLSWYPTVPVGINVIISGDEKSPQFPLAKKISDGLGLSGLKVREFGGSVYTQPCGDIRVIVGTRAED